MTTATVATRNFAQYHEALTAAALQASQLNTEALQLGAKPIIKAAELENLQAAETRLQNDVRTLTVANITAAPKEGTPGEVHAAALKVLPQNIEKLQQAMTRLRGAVEQVRVEMLAKDAIHRIAYSVTSATPPASLRPATQLLARVSLVDRVNEQVGLTGQTPLVRSPAVINLMAQRAEGVQKREEAVNSRRRAENELSILNARFNAEVEKFTAAQAATERELSALQEKSNKDLAHLQALKTQAEAELRTIQDKFEELSAPLIEQRNAAQARLEEEMNGSTTRMKAASALVRDLDARIVAVRDANKIKNSELSRALSVVTTALEKARQESTTQVQALESQFTQLNARKAELEQALAQPTGEVELRAKLETEVKRLEETHQKKLADLEAAIATLKSQIEKTKSDDAAKLRDLQDTKERLEAELAEVTQAAEEMASDTRAECAKQDLLALPNQKESALSPLRHALDMQTALVAKLDEEITNYPAKLEKLRAQLVKNNESEGNELHTLRLQLEGMTKQAGELTREKVRISEEIRKFEYLLSESASGDEARAQDSNPTLLERYNELRTQTEHFIASQKKSLGDVRGRIAEEQRKAAEDINKLEGQIQELKRSKADAEGHLKISTEALQKLANAVGVEEKALAGIKLDGLADEALVAAQAAHAAQTARLAEARRAHTEATEGAAESNAKAAANIERLKEVIAKTQATILSQHKSSQETLTTLTTAEDQLAKELATNEANLASGHQAYLDQKARVVRDCAAAREDLATAEREQRDLAEQIAKATDDLTRRSGPFESRQKALEGELHTLENKWNETRDTRAKVAEKIKSASDELMQTEAGFNTREQELIETIATFERRKHELSAGLASLNSNISAVQRDLVTATKSVDENMRKLLSEQEMLTAQLRDAIPLHEQARLELQQRTTLALDSIAKDVEVRRTELARLVNDIAQVDAQRTSLVNAAQVRGENLNTEQLTAQNALDQANEGFKKESADIEASLVAAKQNLGRLRVQMEVAVAAARNELTSVEQSLAGLDQEMGQELITKKHAFATHARNLEVFGSTYGQAHSQLLDKLKSFEDERNARAETFRKSTFVLQGIIEKADATIARLNQEEAEFNDHARGLNDAAAQQLRESSGKAAADLADDLSDDGMDEVVPLRVGAPRLMSDKLFPSFSSHVPPRGMGQSDDHTSLTSSQGPFAAVQGLMGDELFPSSLSSQVPPRGMGQSDDHTSLTSSQGPFAAVQDLMPGTSALTSATSSTVSAIASSRLAPLSDIHESWSDEELSPRALDQSRVNRLPGANEQRSPLVRTDEVSRWNFAAPSYNRFTQRPGYVPPAVRPTGITLSPLGAHQLALPPLSSVMEQSVGTGFASRTDRRDMPSAMTRTDGPDVPRDMGNYVHSYAAPHGAPSSFGGYPNSRNLTETASPFFGSVAASSSIPRRAGGPASITEFRRPLEGAFGSRMPGSLTLASRTLTQKDDNAFESNGASQAFSRAGNRARSHTVAAANSASSTTSGGLSRVQLGGTLVSKMPGSLALASRSLTQKDDSSSEAEGDDNASESDGDLPAPAVSSVSRTLSLRGAYPMPASPVPPRTGNASSHTVAAANSASSTTSGGLSRVQLGGTFGSKMSGSLSSYVRRT